MIPRNAVPLLWRPTATFAKLRRDEVKRVRVIVTFVAQEGNDPSDPPPPPATSRRGDRLDLHRGVVVTMIGPVDDPRNATATAHRQRYARSPAPTRAMIGRVCWQEAEEEARARRQKKA